MKATPMDTLANETRITTMSFGQQDCYDMQIDKKDSANSAPTKEPNDLTKLALALKDVFSILRNDLILTMEIFCLSASIILIFVIIKLSFSIF